MFCFLAVYFSSFVPCIIIMQYQNILKIKKVKVVIKQNGLFQSQYILGK